MTNEYRQPDVREKIGDAKHIAYVNLASFVDGPEAGTRFVDVRLAGGLQALVLADRGMDLGQVWFRGHPLAWTSSTGAVNPAYGNDANWLELFHGGMLTGVGLENVGLPSEVEGTKYGLHGRLSMTPARNVHWYVPDDDPNAIEVRGVVRETAVHGVDLELTRTYRFSTQESAIVIKDQLRNLGYAPAPVLILYHVNIGYPVVDEHARIIAPDHEAVPFNDQSVAGVDDHLELGPPRADAQAEVFELCWSPSTSDDVTVGVVNETFEPTDGIGVFVEYSRANLPRSWEWRMLGQGRYLVGIEPSTCSLRGRADALASGDVEFLGPGQTRTIELRISVAAGADLRSRVEPQEHRK